MVEHKKFSHIEYHKRNYNKETKDQKIEKLNEDLDQEAIETRKRINSIVESKQLERELKEEWE